MASPSLESGKKSRWSRPKKSLPTLFSVSSESGEMRLRNRSLYDKMEYEQNSFDSGIDASFLSNPDCFASPPRKALEPLLSPASPPVSELLPSLSEALKQWRRRRVALFDSEETRLPWLNALVGVVIVTSAIFALLLLVNKVNFDVDNVPGGKYAAIQFAFDKRNALAGDAGNVVLGEQAEVLNGKRASIQYAHVKRRSVADTSNEAQESEGPAAAVPEAPVRPQREGRSERREKLSAAPPLRPPRPMQSDDNIGKDTEDAKESKADSAEKKEDTEKETNAKEAKEKSMDKKDVSKTKSEEASKGKAEKSMEEIELKRVAKTENAIKVDKAPKVDEVSKKASDTIKPSSSPIHVRKARSPQSKPFRLNPTQAGEQSSSDQSFRVN